VSHKLADVTDGAWGMAMAGMVRRTPTRRPAGAVQAMGMLRRGFAPPGQSAASGNGASAVLMPHRAR
jgi:hypothetical protein